MFDLNTAGVPVEADVVGAPRAVEAEVDALVGFFQPPVDDLTEEPKRVSEFKRKRPLVLDPRRGDRSFPGRPLRLALPSMVIADGRASRR